MKTNLIKPDMTVESKARFFALYYGQYIRFWTVNGSHSLSKNTTFTKALIKYTALLLKPLSSITDEDVIEVAGIMKINIKNPTDDIIPFIHRCIKMYIDKRYKGIDQHVLDFLRSRGYALPFMDWPVEQMVEAGWIKLSEKGGSSNGNV